MSTFFKGSRPVIGPTHPSVQRLPGISSSGVNRPWRDANTSSTEITNERSYTSTAHIVHRDKFTLIYCKLISLLSGSIEATTMKCGIG
jgi:hypothetical protein